MKGLGSGGANGDNNFADCHQARKTSSRPPGSLSKGADCSPRSRGHTGPSSSTVIQRWLRGQAPKSVWLRGAGDLEESQHRGCLRDGSSLRKASSLSVKWEKISPASHLLFLGVMGSLGTLCLSSMNGIPSLISPLC